MIKLIIGNKGSGKTKKLIDAVNETAKNSPGNVVCIEKGVKLRYDIKPTARLIDTEEYMISDAQALYGFVAGILASNHDVTDLFIDSSLKICGGDVAAFETLATELDELSEKTETKITATLSLPVEEAGDIIKKFM